MSSDLFNKGLGKFDRWMDVIVNSLSSARRRVLFRTIARDLRKANQKRISKQINPDGDAWEARKFDNGSGQVRKKIKMMIGLRSTRRLKITAGPDGATIGFSGRNAKIAAVHHFGGMDLVDPDSTTKIRYPVRQLLGVTKEDQTLIRDRVFGHIETAAS